MSRDNPARYRNRVRRALRRFDAGQIDGRQLAADVQAYLDSWDAHNPRAERPVDDHDRESWEEAQGEVTA